MDFTANPLLLNVALFAVAAGLIWFAGGKLERYSSAIAARTGLGRAFLGLLLLAGATSLPELATTVTATSMGNVSMAVHNLLGGVVMQTVVLAVADLAIGRKALSHQSPHFPLLIQAVGLTFLLSTVLLGVPVVQQIAGQSVGEENLVVALWCGLLLAAYLLLLFATYRSQHHPRWKPTGSEQPAGDEHQSDAGGSSDKSLARLGLYFAVGSTVVLVAGWAVVLTGDAIAKQSGISGSFIGFTLVAIATSLPEVSTTLAAVRAGRYETAFANIFGSNAFDTTMLVLVAALAGGAAMIQGLSPSAVFAAALGIFLTCIYLWGLLEREDRTVWRFGWDSTAVLVMAGLGNVIVYWLK